MNFKIIETESQFPDVLLYRDRDSNGTELVNILAIGTLEDSDDSFASETASFDSHESAIDFIRYYTKHSANSFCKRQGIKF